jgi:hypothetical protein
MDSSMNGPAELEVLRMVTLVLGAAVCCCLDGDAFSDCTVEEELLLARGLVSVMVPVEGASNALPRY